MKNVYFIFYKTHNVFLAEERLSCRGIKSEIVPTPVQDKAYCGICLEIYEHLEEQISAILNDIEYKVVK